MKAGPKSKKIPLHYFDWAHRMKDRPKIKGIDPDEEPKAPIEIENKIA